MAKVIHTVPHLITPLNGVVFHALERTEGGSISEEISEEVAQNFLQIPTFELFVDPAAAPAAPATFTEKSQKETAPERKARLAAEAAAAKEAEDKAAAEKVAADKAEADRLAAEEQDRLAAEEQARIAAENAAKGESKPEGDEGEVF